MNSFTDSMAALGRQGLAALDQTDAVIEQARLPYLLPARAERWLVATVVGLALAWIVFFPFLASYRLTWDTPSVMSWDGALYTDEGFYSTDAITWYLDGRWYTPNEYNQYIALPLLQYIQGFFFWLAGGPSLLVVRAINLGFTMAWAGATWVVFHRLVGWKWATAGVALILFNHTTFAMSRFALAEMPMSFFATAALACALYARGKWAYGLAAACALLYACAILCKINGVYLAPVIAVVMIAVDCRWKPVAIKFVLCSVLFFLPLALHYWFVVRPIPDEVAYFFSLNAGPKADFSWARLSGTFWFIYSTFGFADLKLFGGLSFFFLWAALIFGGRERGNPLLWLAVLWFVLFLMLYSFYGQIYARFQTAAYPAFHGLVLACLVVLWRRRAQFSYLLPVAAVFVAMSTWDNAHKVYSYSFQARNTYNEMAADIARQIEADPSGNRVVMGHHAASLALRIPGIYPRHDRYGMLSFDQRLLEHQPGWYVSENLMRHTGHDGYFSQHEWIQRYFVTELRGRYNVLDNYRGYPLAFYKLTPRVEEQEGARRRERPPVDPLIP